MKRLNLLLMLALAPLAWAQTVPNTVPTNTLQVTNATNGGQNFLQQFYGDNTNAPNRRAANGPSPFWSAVKVIFFTALFGVAAYFIIKFLVAKTGLPATEDDNLLELILSKPAGLGNYLEVMKLGSVYYLLSVSSDGLRLIDKITDKETIDYIELNKEKLKPKDSGKFFDILTFFPSFKKIDKLGFLKGQKDKLKKM